MTRLLGLYLLASLALLAVACAPQVAPEAPPDTAVVDSPHAELVQRSARAAWHRMEAGYLETGAYSTNVLADLPLPQGVRWTVASFDEGDYRLDFTSAAVPDIVWVVTPSGVEARRGETD